jgi:glycosyltransferase involved in cell wall biosynthesis
MKKILLVSNMYPSGTHPSYGVFVKNFEDSIQNKGISIVAKAVIKGRGKNLPAKILKYMAFFKDVLYLGLSEKYDIVYVHYINHTALPVYLLSLLKPKCKLVFNAHGGDIVHETAFAKLIFPLAKLNIRKSSLVVVPSYYFQEVLKETHKNLRLNIFISPSGGINLDLFYPIQSLKDNNTLNVGYVGRLDEGKGWEILLEAVAVLKYKYNLNITAHFIGDGGQKEQFLKRIEELGINDSIRYYGQKPQSELVQYFNKFDVFVFPSYRLGESLGLVGLEAMACGVPVIGANIGGIATYLVDGYQGYLFQEKDVDDLTEKILKFSRLDKNTIDKFKTNAIETANKYENKLVANQMIKCLESL